MMYKKIIFLIGILSLTAGLLLFLNSPPLNMRDDTFYIEKGESLTRVAARLEERNLIKNEKFFKYLAFFEGRTNVLIGKYKIYRGMSSADILKKFSTGDVVTRKITIPEGSNIYEIAEKLAKNEITDENDFLKYSFNQEFLRSIGINYISAEGFLFPDTYVFAEGQDARDIINTMIRQFHRIINTMDFSNMKKLKLNTYEIISMASLIEKEYKVPAEMRYISAVFHNRLARNIRLGSCPSVRYAMKKFKAKLTYKDLKYNSPFNTYLHKGLPPGPICSPGKNSVIAALNPVKTNYLYFVSRNDGSHYFSKSLKEHNRAAEYYQKGINNGFIDNQRL